MARSNAYINEINKHIGKKIQMLRLSQGHTESEKIIDSRRLLF
jgi:hypothetical protein